MNRRLYLLLIVIAIGIQPVCAQGNIKSIDLELASDDTFSEALDESTDVEMIKKNDLAANAASAAEAIVEAQKKIQESAETAKKAEATQKNQKKGEKK